MQDAKERQLIYKFMMGAAGFIEEACISNMVYYQYGYGVKLVPHEEIDGIYFLYRCDEDGKIYGEKPIVKGTLKEIFSYLIDETNINEVLSFM